jgi:hypothetical protein
MKTLRWTEINSDKTVLRLTNPHTDNRNSQNFLGTYIVPLSPEEYSRTWEGTLKQETTLRQLNLEHCISFQHLKLNNSDLLRYVDPLLKDIFDKQNNFILQEAINKINNLKTRFADPEHLFNAIITHQKGCLKNFEDEMDLKSTLLAYICYVNPHFKTVITKKLKETSRSLF